MRILIIIISFPFWVSAQLKPHVIEDFCIILEDSTLKTWGMDNSTLCVLPNYMELNDARKLVKVFGNNNSTFQNLDSILSFYVNQNKESSKKKNILSRKTIKKSCLSRHFIISKKSKSKWRLSISEKIQCENQFVYLVNIYTNPEQSEIMYAELIWLLVFDSNDKLQTYYFVELIS